MLNAIAKVAVTLNVDNLTNHLVESLYTNNVRTTRFARRFQILGYHKVSLDPHPFFEPIHPQLFEQQMQFLKSCYRVMSLQELVARSRRGDVPERAVAITFDDGYRDNYENAFPILKKYGFPATIFVATGVIGTSDLIWHDRVFDAFRFATVSHARLKDVAVTELILDSEETRNESLASTLATAKTLYGVQRENFIEEIESNLCPKVPVDRRQRMLSWEQIHEMQNAGIEFGSHTVTHTILSRIPKSEMMRELRESKEELADGLRRPVSLFAYPNGKAADYNDEVKRAVRECGYSCAVTCCPGFNHAYSDEFELKRGLPWHREIELFRFKFFLQRHGLAS